MMKLLQVLANLYLYRERPKVFSILYSWGMRMVLLICCIVMVSEGMAQRGSNPFDIPSRLNEKTTEVSETTEENVFDVRNRNEVVNKNPIQELPIDRDTMNSQQEVEKSDVVESDLVPPVVDNDDEELELDGNPFEVSHVPLRKSKLKKEANALSSKKRKVGSTESGSSNAFIFWLILFSGFIIALVINLKRKIIQRIAKSILNENLLKLTLREEKGKIQGHFVLLYILYFINAGIFMYLILYNFQQMEGWKVFQYCFLGIVACYLLKHLFLFFLKFSFPVKNEVSLYGFTIQTFNIFIGITLIPINLLVAFGPQNIVKGVIIIMIIFVGLILLIRVFRSLFIASKFIQENLFHFLLYLCAFEILPALILIKVIFYMELSL